jgi:hypothetical protein
VELTAMLGLALCVVLSARLPRLWRPLGRVRVRILLAILGVYLLGQVLDYVPWIVGPDQIHEARLLWANEVVLLPLVMLVALIGRPDPVRRRLWIISLALGIFIARSVVTMYTSGVAGVEWLPLGWYTAYTLGVPALALVWLLATNAALGRWERRRARR